MPLQSDIEADIKYTARVVCGNASSSGKEKARAKLRELVKIGQPKFVSHENRRLWSVYQSVKRGGYDL